MLADPKNVVAGPDAETLKSALFWNPRDRQSPFLLNRFFASSGTVVLLKFMPIEE